MAKRKAWTRTIEAHGQSVRLYERGSAIYREVRTADGKDRKSLGHGDRDKAVAQAKALCEHLADLSINPDKRPDSLTLGRLRRLYLASRKGKSLSRQRRTFVEGTLALFEAHLGEGYAVVRFSDNTAEGYARARATGDLKSDSNKARDSVSAGTIRNELDALSTVCNWATREKNERGVALLKHNPVRGTYRPEYAKEDRKRPRLSEDRYLKLLEVADDVDPAGRFRVLLVLAWETGRRINAICHLRVSDFLPTQDALRAALADAGRSEEPAQVWKAAIRWRAEWDKVGRETFAPVSPKVVETVSAYLRSSGRIGDAFMFPGSGGADSLDKQMAGYYLRRAEKLAGLPHVRRGGWHAFRRAWAHRRKDLSALDVAAVGGWFDLQALQDAYQSSDAERMLGVVNGDG